MVDGALEDLDVAQGALVEEARPEGDEPRPRLLVARLRTENVLPRGRGDLTLAGPRRESRRAP